jgi:hypothetical protein
MLKRLLIAALIAAVPATVLAHPPPLPARLMAAASLTLWLFVATAGRMIAYS